jgi:hypothetical protein
MIMGGLFRLGGMQKVQSFVLQPNGDGPECG